MAQIKYQNAPVPNLNGATELYMKALNSYNPAESLVGAMDAIKQRAQEQNAEDVYARASQITDASQFAQGLQDGSIVQPDSNIFGVNADVYKNLMAQRGAIAKDQVLQKAYTDAVQDDETASKFYQLYHPAYELGNDGKIDEANALIRKVTQDALAQNPEYARSLDRLGYAKYFDKLPWEKHWQDDRHHMDNLALGKEKLAVANENNRLKAQANMIKAAATASKKTALEDEAETLAAATPLIYALEGEETAPEQVRENILNNYDFEKGGYVTKSGKLVKIPQNLLLKIVNNPKVLDAAIKLNNSRRGKKAQGELAVAGVEAAEQGKVAAQNLKNAAEITNLASTLNPESNRLPQFQGRIEGTFDKDNPQVKQLLTQYSGQIPKNNNATFAQTTRVADAAIKSLNNPATVEKLLKAGDEGIYLEDLVSDEVDNQLKEEHYKRTKYPYNSIKGLKTGVKVRIAPETNRVQFINAKTGEIFSDPITQEKYTNRGIFQWDSQEDRQRLIDTLEAATKLDHIEQGVYNPKNLTHMNQLEAKIGALPDKDALEGLTEKTRYIDKETGKPILNKDYVGSRQTIAAANQARKMTDFTFNKAKQMVSRVKPDEIFTPGGTLREGPITQIQEEAKNGIKNITDIFQNDADYRDMDTVRSVVKNKENYRKSPAEIYGILTGDPSIDKNDFHQVWLKLQEDVGPNLDMEKAFYAMLRATKISDNDWWIDSLDGAAWKWGETGVSRHRSIDSKLAAQIYKSAGGTFNSYSQMATARDKLVKDSETLNSLLSRMKDTRGSINSYSIAAKDLEVSLDKIKGNVNNASDYTLNFGRKTTKN